MFDFTAIDFETANNRMSSACSVGLVAVCDLKIVKEDYFLIKPSTSTFSQKNISIHGITYDYVKNSPTFAEIWPLISPYFTNSSFIFAHNAHFDMSVLNECLEEYEIEKPSFQYMDSINFSSKVCTRCGTSLTDRCAYFHIETDNHHNALSDAQMCAKLVIASVHSSRFISFFTYVKTFSSLKINEFQEIKSQKFFRNETSLKKIAVPEITASNAMLNTSNPLYGKTCVFTGELDSYNRNDAIEAVLEYGGNIKNSISKSTDYLIVGTQDCDRVGSDGTSTKEKKATALIQQGIKIKVLNEEQFLSLISECKNANHEMQKIFDTAYEEDYISSLTEAIKEEFKNPSEQFVCNLAKEVYTGSTPTVVIDRFRELTIHAINNFISDLRYENNSNIDSCDSKAKTVDYTQDTFLSDMELETINFIIHLIGNNNIDYEKWKHYVCLYPSNFKNKWICRICFEQEPHLLILHKFDNTNYETEYLFSEATQLKQIEALLKDTYLNCIAM